MNEQEKKVLAKAFEGIIADERKRPPKVRLLKCGTCQRFIPHTLTCEKYPQGIPGNILREKEECSMFRKK